MTTINLELPESTYLQLQRAAQKHKRSIVELVEQFAAEQVGVPRLSDEIETEIAAFKHLSDDVLLLIARRKLDEGAVNGEAQRAEMADRLMLYKAAAVDVLRERGHDPAVILN